MKTQIVLLLAPMIFSAALVSAQTQQPTSGPIPTDVAERMAAERAARENRERQQQQMDILRAKAVADGIDPNTGRPIRDPQKPTEKIDPRLNEEDKRAISILPDDLKQYESFLRQSKTGIIRLQNADNCPPNNLVVKASAGCPNNVSGKATAYSFRAGDYKIPIFGDIFFKGAKLTTSGVFTIGIYADIGNQDITLLNSSSKGVKELLEFQPPESQTEIDRQYQILKGGVQIGDFVYAPAVNVNTNETYILRSVAYKGKILRGEKPHTVNVLASDERKDVTVVFKVIRQHSDGSIVLLWKELSRADPPKIVLEAKSEKSMPPKNEFTK